MFKHLFILCAEGYIPAAVHVQGSVRNQTQVVRLGQRYLYWLSHLSVLCIYFV